MARTRNTAQLAIEFPNTWGGRRPRAGRKRRAPRPRVPHRRRAALASRFPVHVTVRLADGLPRLRGFEVAKVLRRAFVHGCNKGRFRICQFSIQGNHIHLICEAADATALARGIQGFKVRVARGLNRRWRREGGVFDDRYHAETLETPRQTHAALRYVLLNARHHNVTLPAWCHGVDPFSSAWYFDGWRDDTWRTGLSPPEDGEGPSVAPAHSWLLRTGWRRHGLIDVADRPGRRA